MLRNVGALLCSYALWLRKLPQATGILFAARTPLGRSAKIFLFGIGAVLPFGSLIWILLFWHGGCISRYCYSGTGIR